MPNSAIPLDLIRPPNARAALMLAHGAGAGKDHWFMTGICAALASVDIATARFNFAYVRAGRKLPDKAPICEAEVREVCAAVHAAWPDLPLFAGGKSMGGRMTSQTQAATPLPAVRGLVFLGFPLHAAQKPDTKRAAHLRAITAPMLFLQGQRDALADLSLLQPIVAALPTAQLLVIPEADHGFEVPKRTGKDREAIAAELAQAIATFIAHSTVGPTR
jgi:hypothetical protein